MTDLFFLWVNYPFKCLGFVFFKKMLFDARNCSLIKIAIHLCCSKFAFESSL